MDYSKFAADADCLHAMSGTEITIFHGLLGFELDRVAISQRASELMADQPFSRRHSWSIGVPLSAGIGA
jgi:hypothetical protein